MENTAANGMQYGNKLLVRLEVCWRIFSQLKHPFYLLLFAPVCLVGSLQALGGGIGLRSLLVAKEG